MTLGDPDETDQVVRRNCAYAMTFHQSGARDHFCGFLNHMAPRKKATGLTPQHKAALAQGRADGLAVRRYLEALEAHKPKRGRKRSPESIDKRLKKIEELLVDADPLQRLQLVQERMNLQEERARGESKTDLVRLQKEFVKAAGPYSQRKGITYAAWRELGVEPAVLAEAGVKRGS